MNALNRTLGILCMMAALVLLTPATVLAQEEDAPAEEAPQEEMAEETKAMSDSSQSVVAVLKQQEGFTKLAEALEKTGLAQALDSGGPYTIFAPTDSAFAAIPQDQLNSMSADELANLLRNHVVQGEVTAEQLSQQAEVETVGGATLAVGQQGQTVGDAQVTSANLQASNGIIHAIGKVIQPAPEAPESEGMEDSDTEEDGGMEEDTDMEEPEEDSPAMEDTTGTGSN